MQIPHIPVLYNETLEAFENINEGYIIDCTLGYAGHSFGLLEQNANVKLICNDQDEEALEFSKNRLAMVMSLKEGTFLIGRLMTSLNSSAVEKINSISSLVSCFMPNK